jgi:hypothetical protein
MSTAIIVIAPHSMGLLPTGKLIQWSSPAKQVSTLCVLPGFRSALEIHRKDRSHQMDCPTISMLA